jgi:hypothetical protein
MHKTRIFGAILAGLAVSNAMAISLPLNSKKFAPIYVGLTSDNARACLAGVRLDSESGQGSGELLLLDLKRDSVIGQAHIPAPEDYVSLEPVQCALDGDNVYLLANVNTQAARSLNQGLVYLYQFNLQGKLLGKKELALPGRSSYGQALGVSANGLQVAGYSKDEDDTNEYYSSFTLAVDPRLKEGKLNVRKTGAFYSGAEARFVGDSLHIAGNFLPAKLAKNEGADDYANSRLLANGGYAWSVRPFKQQSRKIDAGISSRGVTYSLAYADAGSTLAVISPEGKQVSQTSFPSKYCTTNSISEYGAGVLALREPCGKQQKGAVLLAIANGVETPLQLAPGEPVFATTNAGQWFVVSKDAAGKLSWNSGSVEAGTRFTQTVAGVEHSLSIGRVNSAKKGERSFDFAYEQRAGDCRFSMNGHAVEVDVFNPESADGKELPPVVLYDSDGIALTLPADGPPRQVSLTAELSPEQAKRSCGGKAGRKLSLSFKTVIQGL